MAKIKKLAYNKLKFNTYLAHMLLWLVKVLYIVYVYF